MMTLRGPAPAAAAAASAASTAASAALICDGRGDISMGNKRLVFCYYFGDWFYILLLPGMIQTTPTSKAAAWTSSSTPARGDFVSRSITADILLIPIFYHDLGCGNIPLLLGYPARRLCFTLHPRLASRSRFDHRFAICD